MLDNGDELVFWSVVAYTTPRMYLRTCPLNIACNKKKTVVASIHMSTLTYTWKLSMYLLHIWGFIVL